MIYPDTSKEEWCALYGINPDASVSCSKCRNEVPMEVPIAMKGYRGLEGKPCGKCGHNDNAFIVIPLKDKEGLWSKLFDIFTDT